MAIKSLLYSILFNKIKFICCLYTMSDLLSVQLLREINDELSDTEDDPINIGEIEVQYTLIKGLREGSCLVWAHEEEHLYYKNSFSNSKNVESCKCYMAGCRVRLYIRSNGTAFRRNGIEHAKNHGSMYVEYKIMHCFNIMKQKANTAVASTTTFQIYQEAVSE